MTHALLADKLLSRRLITPTGCWEWQGATSDGYGMVCVGNRRNDRVHRVAYTLWVGPIPPRLFVLHKCDNRPCFNPEHLYVGTKHQNSLDMAHKGRAPFGERSGRAKLTWTAVEHIRSQPRTVTNKAIAGIYDVDPSTISRIRNDEGWPQWKRP